MLTVKIFENWWVWIVTDVIYIPLYASQRLFLTSIVYALFLAMCLAGLRDWRRTLRGGGPAPAIEVTVR
jgi:nicotinamide mononucleotide transporter